MATPKLTADEQLAKVQETLDSIKTASKDSSDKALADIAKLRDDITAHQKELQEMREKGAKHDEVSQASLAKMSEAVATLKSAHEAVIRSRATDGEDPNPSLFKLSGLQDPETTPTVLRAKAYVKAVESDHNLSNLSNEYSQEFLRAWMKRGSIREQVRTSLSAKSRKVEAEVQAAVAKANPLIFGASEINTDVGEEGALFLPHEMRQSIIERTARMGCVRPMADIATLGQGGGQTLEVPVQETRATAMFVDTRDNSVDRTEVARTRTVEIRVNKAMAKVGIEKDFRHDAPAYALSYLMRTLDQALTDIANEKFLLGENDKEPRGLLKKTFAATADVNGFKIARVKTGVSGDFPAAAAGQSPGEPFIKAIHQVYADKRANGAAWGMSRATMATARSLADGDGNFAWQVGMSSGMPDTLFGYPILEDDWMPEIAANSNSVLFLTRGAYVIVESSESPYVIIDDISRDMEDVYKSYVRVGGDAVDPFAIVVIQFAA